MTRGHDMEAKNMNRTRGPKFTARLALLASAAVMTATFTASTTAAAPRAEVSYSKAQKALAKGKITKAIEYAEKAVLADPRNAEYRALLGKAYLETGRYQSAAMSFGDALELGDQNPRTVLSYALTQTAIGGGKNALDKLMKFERSMDPADAGLAMALAGDPERGVFVLTNALRSGQNSAKVRQNLAYTYALAGNWRAARVMAAEDVPADQLDARLSDWASNARPEDHMVRVAQLLGISPERDNGVPTKLALSNFPSPAQMAAAAKAKAPVKPVKKAPTQIASAPKSVAKPVAKPAPAKVTPTKVASTKPSPVKAAPNKTTPKPVSKMAKSTPAKPAVTKSVEKKVDSILAATTTSAPTRVAAKSAPTKEAKAPRKTTSKPRTSSKTVAKAQPASTGPSFVSRPVTQELPAPTTKAPAPQRVAAAPKPVTKVAAKPAPKGDSHMVQLGSYNSEAEAKAGWTTLQRKFGELKTHDVLITKAEVNGKTFYRVAAAGFGRQGAAQMCSTVRGAGRGCFAYAKTNPPAGAVDNGTRMAAASRR
ncbi:MAG: tetratricopeptide repeat protein [Pseudomonadota bacterium]